MDFNSFEFFQRNPFGKSLGFKVFKNSSKLLHGQKKARRSELFESFMLSGLFVD